mmetsp:Transcript_99008/g.166771  ORF Transcript_99008/g.166771 Transcript_99008/m.166771 type:complete len:88 (+) Transcript_99008:738-1001(+)
MGLRMLKAYEHMCMYPRVPVQGAPPQLPLHCLLCRTEAFEGSAGAVRNAVRCQGRANWGFVRQPGHAPRPAWISPKSVQFGSPDPPP